MDGLTEAQLAELEDDLLGLREALEQAVSAGGEGAKPVELDQAKVGRVSRVDALQQQQMASSSLASMKHRLGLVKRALAAMEDGTYGECLQCEEPIPFKRLKVLPEATLCIGCAGGRPR